MTQRRSFIRWLVAFAALLFIPALSSPAEAGNLNAALKYAPRKAIGVGTVDVANLQRLPIYKKLVTKFLSEEPTAKKNLDKLKAQTGFDAFRDIKALVVALGPDIEQDEDQFVVIAEAKVDEQRMVAFIRREGGKLQVKNDALGRWYAIDNGEGGLAFRGPHVIVGEVGLFKEALTKKGPSPKLKTLIAPYLTKDLGFAGLVPAKVKRNARREMKQLGDLDTVRGGGSLQQGLDLEVIAGFTSSASASRLASLANQFLDKARQSPDAQRMGLGKLAQKLQVGSLGKDLRATLKLTRQETDELVKILDGLI